MTVLDEEREWSVAPGTPLPHGCNGVFDQGPLLFFTLRGIDFEPLIGKTVDQKLDMMLANADKPSPRIIDDCDLNRLFGILR